MNRIVVDDVSLWRRPAFLSVNDPSCTVHTTPSAFASASSFAVKWRLDRGMASLLELASTKGALLVQESRDVNSHAKWDAVPSSVLRPVEAATINLALAIMDAYPEDELWVSLQSDSACGVANSLGLRAAPPNIIAGAIRDAEKSTTIDDLATRAQQDRLVHRVLTILCVAVLGFGALQAASHIGKPITVTEVVAAQSAFLFLA